MKIPSYIFLISWLSLWQYSFSYSQSFQKGTPLTIHRLDSLRNVVDDILLPRLENASLIMYADSISQTSECKDCKSRYYGQGINKSINIKNVVSPEPYAGRGRVWLLRISSPTAYGMQFYFSEFRLPFEASLFFYNEDRSMILGAFTSNNNNLDTSQAIQFGTQWIQGNTIYIEYYEPYSAEFDGKLVIENIVHIYRDVFSRSGPFSDPNKPIGPCHLNVKCQEGNSWSKEINSVALILKYNYAFSLTSVCTGVLINNTEIDERPLLLTAGHCVDLVNPGYNGSTYLFLFNHQSNNCNSDGSEVSATTTESIYGSSILSADDFPMIFTSDYALLELHTTKDVLSDYSVCYAGWDRSGSTGAPPFIGIHHPSGEIKKISIDNNPLGSINFQTSQQDPQGDFWQVKDWDKGVTHGGSSGSPLFNSNHRIIGQLYGGGSECVGSTGDNGAPDIYGKFSQSWSYGGLSFWLDPYSKGDISINTYCPTSCYDNVKNGNETGVDCGGNCPPCSSGSTSGGPSVCYTIEHVVNGQSAMQNNFINVCKSNIIISPYSHTNCKEFALWNVTVVEQKISNHIPCAVAGTPPGIPIDCATDYSPIPYILLADLSCICTYHKLFLGIQECDQNKNPIGIEYSHWFDYNSTLSGQSIFKQINLLHYLPPGASIEEGKYYKIKTATSKNGWKEYSSYIRVYKDNLLIDQQNITQNQFANSISIVNSYLPFQARITVTAKQRIEILPSTILENGSFLINYFDCNSLDQFMD